MKFIATTCGCSKLLGMDIASRTYIVVGNSVHCSTKPDFRIMDENQLAWNNNIKQIITRSIKVLGVMVASPFVTNWNTGTLPTTAMSKMPNKTLTPDFLRSWFNWCNQVWAMKTCDLSSQAKLPDCKQFALLPKGWLRCNDCLNEPRFCKSPSHQR